LSAADYGELVGVSGLTIYNWEKGKTKPREAQLDKWLTVKGIGKRKAWRQLQLI
jgi:transcriptional regulator with XRE-family HTH domain